MFWLAYAHIATVRVEVAAYVSVCTFCSLQQQQQLVLLYIVVVVESKSTSTATTLVFGAGKERRELCRLSAFFCRLSASSSFCNASPPVSWPNSRGHQSIQESNRVWLSLQSDLGHTRQRLGHHFKTPKLDFGHISTSAYSF